MAVWKSCERCGCVVADMSIHEQWHSHVQEVTDADDERS